MTGYPHLLPTGFETKVVFGNDIGLVLCTGFGITDNVELLESSGGYGGKLLNDAQQQMAINMPYVLDYGKVTGEVTFEPYYGQVKNIVDWFRKTRNVSAEITVSTGDSGSRIYPECYFNSIGFSISENSILNTSVGIDVIQRAFDSGTILNKLVKLQGMLPTSSKPNWINNYVEGLLVIPYWATGIRGSPFSEFAISWDFNVNQEIVRKTYCIGDANSSSSAPDPAMIFIGQLSIDYNYTSVLVKENDQAVNINDLMLDMYENNDKVEIDFGDGEDAILKISDITTTGGTPQVTDMGSVIVADLSFKAYKMES